MKLLKLTIKSKLNIFYQIYMYIPPSSSSQLFLEIKVEQMFSMQG